MATKRILDTLADNPAQMAALISDLTANQLRASPDSHGWSANDLLAHLRSCADVWGSCIASMPAQDDPTIRIVSPRTSISSTNYRELEYQVSWDVFIEQRINLLLILKSPSSQDWMRPAISKDARLTLNRTVQFYADLLARHERSHLKQLRQIFEAILA
ncbi:hypothetical protein BH09CHL1_BH09CHL1_12660 [soil metagenome]